MIHKRRIMMKIGKKMKTYTMMTWLIVFFVFFFFHASFVHVFTVHTQSQFKANKKKSSQFSIDSTVTVKVNN